MEISGLRSELTGTTDDCEHCSVRGACIECDSHDVPSPFALKDVDTSAVDRAHIWKRENPKSVRVPFRDDGDVYFLAAKYHPVCHIDVVGSKKPANCEFRKNFPIKSECEQRAVGVFICPQDKAARRIFSINPDRRIVRVVTHLFRDDLWLYDRG